MMSNTHNFVVESTENRLAAKRTFPRGLPTLTLSPESRKVN